MLPDATNRQPPGAQPGGVAAPPLRWHPLPRPRSGNLAVSTYIVGVFLLALVWVIVALELTVDPAPEIEPAYLWAAALLSVALLALVAIQRRIAGAVAERERRYRTIIDAMSEGVVLRSADRSVLLSNPAAARILGTKLEGADYDELRRNGAVREDGSPFPEAEFPAEITLRTGKSVRHVVIGIRRPDGTVRWISLNAEPVFEAGAALPGAVVISYDDITERKQAEEELRHRHRRDELIFRISTRFLLARDDHAAAAIDDTLADVGRFVAADRCYVSLLDESGGTYSLSSEWCAEGIASKRPVRQHLPAEELWKSVDRDEIAYVTVSGLPPGSELVRQVLESAGIRSSLRVSIRMGGNLFGVLGLDSVREEKRWTEDVAVLLRVVADILGSALARERAQAEIRRLNAGLEQRVHERTLQLEAINQELEAFSYSVSHDLRGPLRRIEGFSRILLMSHTDRLDEQARGLFARVRHSTQHMGYLIDDLLKLARVNRQPITRHDIDLSAMAREVLAGLASAEPDREVECTVADGLAVNADRGLMRVVLENLIGNAWKFTGKSPGARIEIETREIDGETVYLVRDNGAGFDMAYAANLFGAFQRLHTPEEFEGSGIGLATVRRIVTRHGGRVWAESAPGKGATFYFTVGAGDLT